MLNVGLIIVGEDVLYALLEKQVIVFFFGKLAQITKDILLAI